MTPRRELVGAGILLLLMMAVYAAGYAFSAVHTDSADELWKAWEIRHGVRYPVQGPPLGQVLHLGPAWFYLASIPLWLGLSWLGSAIFIGAVCSLKFPLAYYCGSRLLDRDLGLLWALCLLFPGWPSFEQLIFLNPNAVAAAILAILALCLAPLTLLRAFALGLAVSLGVHVHPTVLPALAFALPGIWAQRHDGRFLAQAAGLFVLGALLPLAPYVVSQALNGFPDWSAASGYVRGEVSLANVVNTLAVLWHYFFDGPRIAARFLVEAPEIAAAALGWANVALVAAGLVALFQPRGRWLALAAMLALLVWAACIAFLRTTTPLQFTWALAVPASLVVALGLHALVTTQRPGLLLGFAGLVFASAIVMTLGLAKRVAWGDGILSMRVMDIKGGRGEALVRDVWFPAYAQESLGRELCDLPRGASLHGHLAFVADKSLLLGAMFACGRRPAVSLAAGGARPNVAGMTRAFWEASGTRPQCWVGPIGIARDATAAAANPGLEVATGVTYLPRRPSGAPVTRTRVEFTAPAAALVLVTNVLGGYEHFRLSSATADGVPARRLAADDLSALLAGAGSGTTAWVIEAEVTNPRGLDVVVIPRRDPNRETPDCN